MIHGKFRGGLCEAGLLGELAAPGEPQKGPFRHRRRESCVFANVAQRRETGPVGDQFAGPEDLSEDRKTVQRHSPASPELYGGAMGRVRKGEIAMNDIKNMKVYFASPWFNPDQAEREERVKGRLRELGFNVWSPKENSSLSPITDPVIREKIFSANVEHIKSCDIIFAITDGKDMGTIWEAGFANGYNAGMEDSETFKPIIIVYYCETLGPNGQFNLMLAQSGNITITKFEDLDKLPELIEKNEGLAYAGIVE